MVQDRAHNKNNIKAVILAGSLDFGRCPVATHIPTALWPVAGKTVLERLLIHLARQGVKRVVVCCGNGCSQLRESINPDNHPEVSFMDEQLPAGPAGCIRRAGGAPNDLLLIFPASIVCPPDIDVLINAHRDGKSDLTVMFNPNCRNGDRGETSGVYVCEASVLEHIPREGYFDIKESLIPEMLRAGKSIHAAILPSHAGNFRNREEYMRAISNYLDNGVHLDGNLRRWKGEDLRAVWVERAAKIDPSARIFGPVVIMEGACVSEDAVILGPSVVGQNVRIGKSSVVENSVLWDGSQVGPNCQVKRCLVDYRAAIGSNSRVDEQSISFKSKGILASKVDSVSKAVGANISRFWSVPYLRLDRISGILPEWTQLHWRKLASWLAAGLVLAAFLWCYWSVVVDLWNIWLRNDEYSSGLLVPFLALYVLWSRRHDIAQCDINPCVWGVFALLAALSVRFFGLFFMYGSAERLSIALSVAALVLLIFGERLFRKVLPILLFLCLMLPWPNRVQAAVSLPLQRWATSSAVFCLEVIGYEIVQEGNIIHIGSATVAVAEACNGLRMITAFFVISSLVVLLVKRSWWEKVFVLASSLPIALLCNALRLAITAVAFTMLEGEQWEKIFHDFGGYAMMPLALLIVIAELWLLRRLTVPAVKQEAVIISKKQ